MKSTCPICKERTAANVLSMSAENETSLALYDAKYYRGMLAKLFVNTEFDVAFCGSCKHLFYRKPPSKEKLAVMYAEHAKVQKQKTKRSFGTNLSAHREKYALLQSLYKQCEDHPKLLDYGAGQGIWSLIAADIGFDVIAFEPHSERVDVSLKHISDWNDMAGMTFDAILCNQTLEHVVSPLETLEDIKSVCHENSLLCCTVPNVGKIKMSRVLTSWPFDGITSHPIAPFQHLHGFSQNSFIKLHEQAGFTVAKRELVLSGIWGVKSIIAILAGRIYPRFSRCAFFFKLASQTNDSIGDQ